MNDPCQNKVLVRPSSRLNEYFPIDTTATCWFHRPLSKHYQVFANFGEEEIEKSCLFVSEHLNNVRI